MPRTGGRLIVSVEHPFAMFLLKRMAGGPKPHYFATDNRIEEWDMGGQTAELSFWDRPLHAMTDSFAAAGFRVSVIHEPRPVPAAREFFPEDFPILDAFPSFLFFVLHAE